MLDPAAAEEEQQSNTTVRAMLQQCQSKTKLEHVHVAQFAEDEQQRLQDVEVAAQLDEGDAKQLVGEGGQLAREFMQSSHSEM